MFAISGLVLVLAAPLPAQTMLLKANIPFEFVTGTQTLPAGDYVIDTGAAPGALRVRNQSTGDASVVLSSSAEEWVRTNPGARLIFNRYGNQYFLSQVWDGHAAGREIPKSKAERELLAESRAPETLVILAQR